MHMHPLAHILLRSEGSSGWVVVERRENSGLRFFVLF